MAYTTIDNSKLFFQTKLYTGNSGTNAITFDGSENMQPDFVWLKRRDSGSNNHRLCDSVRGVDKQIYSSANSAQGTSSGVVQSFDSNGFTLNTSDSSVNVGSYVCWNWKAGTSFTNDASSTGIGTIDSTGSFNNTSGFSVITYSGTGSAGTVKHGLNVTPKIIFWKRTDSNDGSVNWIVQSTKLGNQTKLVLNTTEATSTNSSFSETDDWTSTLIDLGTYEGQNDSNGTYVAYSFADVPGYSKISTYIGNGSSDGQFIYTGFMPAVVIRKNTASTTDWSIMDNKRFGYNTILPYIFPNSSAGETTNQNVNNIDFLSQGFKLRESDDDGNASGSTYLYLAFASNPFVTSTGIPTTAF